MPERWIRIRPSDQILQLLEGSRILVSYLVSTSSKGSGERIGSEQTPRGRHEVREMIGSKAPKGTVFVARRPTGEICTPELYAASPERDWILTRVIWLAGREEAKNLGGDVDTFARYIYIHGTPDDEPINEPRSHGCIRMRNDDVIALFDLIQPGTRVEILD
jgi:L,D-transpeptidase YbiS